MKSRIYKSLLVLMAIAMVIDWPVHADAINGKVVGKAIQTAEHSGFFSKCSHQTEQSVNKATQQVERNVAPRAGVVAGKAVQKANASNNRKQSGVCGRCNGSGQIYYNGESYYCPNCKGSGRSY